MASTRRDGLSFGVLLSFNELAWIVVFALAVLYAAEVTRGNSERIARERLALEQRRSVPAALAAPGATERAIRKELLGLRGELGQVAFVVDRSGSMTKGGRWEHVRGIVRVWLEHLAVDRAVLITFGDDVRSFPDDGTLLDLTGPEGAARRTALVSQFAAERPGGYTNTRAALEKALSYPEVDSIVLFTDGAPASGAGFDPAMAEEVYRLCRQRRRHGRAVPINTVGIGDYFDPQLAQFLMRVAADSGGAFLGR